MEINYNLITLATVGVLSGAVAALVYPLVNRKGLYGIPPENEDKTKGKSKLESSLSKVPLWKQPGKGPYGNRSQENH